MDNLQLGYATFTPYNSMSLEDVLCDLKHRKSNLLQKQNQFSGEVLQDALLGEPLKENSSV